MVAMLLEGVAVHENLRVLDPGSGPGTFVGGLLRYCLREGLPVPTIDAVEIDPELHEEAAELHSHPKVTFICRDFLTDGGGPYDLIIANPPYVPITELSEEEKRKYRQGFSCARGRFDLYLLFFEQALRVLAPGGRLVFVTPEKYLRVWTASHLRRMLDLNWVRTLEFVDEAAFAGLTTYPLISSIQKEPSHGRTTRVCHRNPGTEFETALPVGGPPWSAAVAGANDQGPVELVLSQITTRISCGVATGADGQFVLDAATLPPGLEPFARPTVSGAELGKTAGDRITVTSKVMVTPYTLQGELIPEDQPGAEHLFEFLGEPERRKRLLERTCVLRKPWYAFHETPPSAYAQPKILCRDLAKTPRFWIEESGDVMPRHSVYYIVPAHGVSLVELCDYLNSPAAAVWLDANCQRARNNTLRLQSSVLKNLPVPAELQPD